MKLLSSIFALMLALPPCQAAPPDSGLSFGGMAVVRHAGHQWLCAFTKEHLGAQPGYSVVWRITISPWNPEFLKSWYGDEVYTGKIKIAGLQNGHTTMQFADWFIDMLPSDVTMRQQHVLEGKDHGGETGIQTVIITGGLDQFIIVGREPL